MVVLRRHNDFIDTYLGKSDYDFRKSDSYSSVIFLSKNNKIVLEYNTKSKIAYVDNNIWDSFKHEFKNNMKDNGVLLSKVLSKKLDIEIKACFFYYKRNNKYPNWETLNKQKLKKYKLNKNNIMKLSEKERIGCLEVLTLLNNHSTLIPKLKQNSNLSYNDLKILNDTLFESDIDGDGWFDDDITMFFGLAERLHEYLKNNQNKWE